jgi:hypothetical protein
MQSLYLHDDLVPMHNPTWAPMATPDVPDNTFHRDIVGSSGITSTLRFTPVGSYINDDWRLKLWRVDASPCPVVRDCEHPIHSMILVVLKSPVTGTQVYDFPSMVITHNVTSTTQLASESDPTIDCEATLLYQAAASVLTSFQYSGGHVPMTWPYAATVYEGPIHMLRRGGFVSGLMVPNEKRMITTGESLVVGDITSPTTYTYVMFYPLDSVDPEGNEHVMFYDPPAETVDAITDAIDDDAETVDAPSMYMAPFDDQAADDQAALINDLRGEITSLRIAVSNRDAIIATAREACSSATRENGGCDEGKRGFITSTGLWPDASDDEIDDICGIDPEVDFDVSFSVVVNVATSLNVRRSTAQDIECGNLDWSDYIDIDDAIMNEVRYGNADIELTEIEEA